MRENIVKWTLCLICCVWILLSGTGQMYQVSAQTYSDTLFYKGITGQHASMPSKGDVKVLVLAVEFSDMSFEEGIEDKLEEYFFSEENKESRFYPRESVRAFYQRSSFGQLQVTGDIHFVSMPKTRASYNADFTEEVFELYKQELLEENQVQAGNEAAFLKEYLSKYDADMDGEIDGSYICYAGGAVSEASLWWNYVNDWEEHNLGGFVVRNLCMIGDIEPANLIHNMGHLLGLEDYYPDKSGSIMDGIAAIDMMFGNVGDHNVFSKMLLGWIDTENISIISDGIQSFNLEESTKAGDCVIIAPEYETKGLYSQFYLVTYRDFDGNDAMEGMDALEGGLCIYYVNATLNEQGTDFQYTSTNTYKDGRVSIPLIKQMHADVQIMHSESSVDIWGSGSYIPCPWERPDFLMGMKEDICFFHEGDSFTPYGIPSSAIYEGYMDVEMYSGIVVENIVYTDDSIEFDAGFEEQKQDNNITYTLESNSGTREAVDIFKLNILFSADVSVAVQYAEDGSIYGRYDLPLLNERNESVTTLYIDYLGNRKAAYALKLLDTDFQLEENQIYHIVIPKGTFLDYMENEVDEIVIEYSTGHENVVFVDGVSLDKELLQLKIGDETLLSATVTPANAHNKSIIWESGDESVVTIDDAGRLCAVGEGETVITAITEDGGYQATCKVNVVPLGIPMEYVNINEQNVNIRIGDERTLTLRIYPENATNKNVIWSSSNEAIVTVDENGRVRGVGLGTACITVMPEDGSSRSDCNISVYSIDDERIFVESVTLDTPQMQMKLGDVGRLYATISPQNATDQNTMWRSSDENVVMVDAIGRLQAVGEGEAVVTVIANDGSYQADCRVTVCKMVDEETIPVENVSLNRSDLQLELGDTERLYTLFSPQNATNQKVAWESSDDTIVTVDANGRLEAVGIGNASITITAEDGGYQASCSIEVKEKSEDDEDEDKPVLVEGISLNKTELELKAGETEQLQATISPQDATNQSITWESSDETVVTVDAEGRVEAIRDGSAVITATAEDGGYQSSCNVTVIKEEPSTSDDSVHVQGVSVNLQEVVINRGETFTLYAITNPINADNQTVSWNSSDSNVVTVSQQGVLQALQTGTVVITVTTEDGNYTAQCKVVVNPTMVRTIQINKKQVVLKETESVTLSTTILPSEATNQNIIWSSSNEQVVVVDNGGNVTAIAAGTATIIAMAADGSEVSARCDITVEKQDLVVSNLEELPAVGASIILSTGTYKVTKSDNETKEAAFVKLKNKKQTSVIIPATIEIDGYTYKVTEISSKALKNNKKIKSVTIGKNVKKIGKEAFSGCKSLKKISVQSTVLKSVGKNAIKNINKKATIKVPKKQLKEYKKLFKSGTGYKKSMKIKE